MTVNASYLTDLSGTQLSEDGSTQWIHALPLGSYKHPVYGTIDITKDRVQRFVENVKNRVRGTVDPSINYVHDNNNVAAGWVKDAQERTDGLWVFVEWVADAAKAIAEKKWRYFSSEFNDEWEDPQGNKHQDVFLGGALTNRPFMKNLVPINMSEDSVTMAFELVSAITGTDTDSLKGGKSMDEKDMEAIVDKLAEKLKVTPPAPVTPALDLSKVTELKTLAEENPLVDALIKHLESQGTNLVEVTKQLRETEIDARLAEFDRSKIILTPASKGLVRKILSELPANLSEDFWNLLKSMKTSQSFLVELGEVSGVNFKYGSTKSATEQFNELTNVKLSEGMSYPDAVEAVASQNPQLWEATRGEAYLDKGGVK